MATQKTLMKLKDIRKSLSPEQSEELKRITAELDDLKPTQEEMYNDYLNSDLERNARAIEQGVNIFYHYPRMFSKVSAEMPEATHDEVVQHVRSKFLERQRKREPTLKPENQTKIGQRYAKSYADEHTKRIMIAIQHAEESHLPNLKHVKR
jgi:S-adenosylmethionine synthetase